MKNNNTEFENYRVWKFDKEGENILQILRYHDGETEKEAEFNTDGMLHKSKTTMKEAVLLDSTWT